MVMRRLMALLATLGMSLSWTACGSYDDGSVDGLEDWDGMNAEYRAAVASFPYPLPEGIVFPADAPFDSTEDNNLEFGVGFGEMLTYQFAKCACQSVVVANQYGDIDAAMRALDSVEEIYNDPVYRQYVIEGDPSWQSVIDSVRLGDFSDFNEHYQNSCAGWAGLK